VGFEVYGAYLVYKTIVHENLIKAYRGNKELIQSETIRESLLLENIKIAVKDELKKQSKKRKKHEALEKKLEEITKLVTDHIVKGNSVKLLSAPIIEEEAFAEEDEKEAKYLEIKKSFRQLDEKTKQLLISEFTSSPPEDDYTIS
jgi:hypothetical protein